MSEPSVSSAAAPSFDECIARCGLPRLEARLLLSKASGLSRESLLAHGDRTCPPDAASRFGAWVDRRRHGEPIAYLLGVREFFGRPFQVDPRVLIPRPDTESLVARALERLAGRKRPRILDLGTGSGVIAITLAIERPDARVLATDRSIDALDVARANAAALIPQAGLSTARPELCIESQDLEKASLRFRAGDWWEAIDNEPAFDLIVSNPPYVAAGDPHLAIGDLRHEPLQALSPGGDGSRALAILAQGAPCHLKVDGWLLLEHGYGQGAMARSLLESAGFIDVATHPDLAGQDRTTEGRWRRAPA